VSANKLFGDFGEMASLPHPPKVKKVSPNIGP